MTTPLVEMDGDEMTRILWKMIKDELILPFVDLKSEYYDLGLPYRDQTNDQVTIDSAEAAKKYGVAVKCATITPNAQRMDEYKLHKMWKSPNGTIRSIMDGTVFRAPITIPSIHPCVKNWEKPITIARHAYGDVYKSVELRADEPGTAKLVFEGKSGKKQEIEIHSFDGAGVIQGMHNTDKSIRSFAHSCFKFAIDTKQDLWFATKDTISKTYDAQFRKIFEEVYESDYKEKFAELGIEYFYRPLVAANASVLRGSVWLLFACEPYDVKYRKTLKEVNVSIYKEKFSELGIEYLYTLIDDAVARVIRSKGGFIWACKNYDGDVMSDMLSTAFGSLAMMTSVLVSPDGKYEYEAAHGTVTRHYYRYLKGEDTSTNPMATIFAWSGALRKRGELDGIKELQNFGDQLEAACFDTLNDGIATKDLVNLMEGVEAKAVNSAGFIAAIRERLEKRLA